MTSSLPHYATLHIRTERKSLSSASLFCRALLNFTPTHASTHISSPSVSLMQALLCSSSSHLHIIADCSALTMVSVFDHPTMQATLIPELSFPHHTHDAMCSDGGSAKNKPHRCSWCAQRGQWDSDTQSSGKCCARSRHTGEHRLSTHTIARGNILTQENKRRKSEQTNNQRWS